MSPVYDNETQMYYCQSRYYDPEIGRFINADGQILASGDFTGLNLFAYCGNNPVNRVDLDGEGWITALVITAVVSIVAIYMPSRETHYSRNDNQNDILDTAKEIINSDDWVEKDDRVNRYHRHTHGIQGEKAKDNKKYMTKDDRKEVIINFSDPSNPEIGETRGRFSCLP